MVKPELVIDSNRHNHLVFLIDREEIIRLMTCGKFGPGVCDSCNESIFDTGDYDMYLIPDLRDTHCNKCAQRYFRRMRHYKEDIDILSSYVTNMIDFFEFNLTKEDRKMVEDYLDYLQGLKEVLLDTD